MLFLAETVISGLLTGVMYSLVALGFVLIFKASGVFNFAQGVMALFAGLTLAGFLTGTIPITHQINSALAMPPWLAITATVFVMIGLAMLIERLVLRHLVNQEPIILFMMTLGLAYVLEGAGDLLWGSDVKVLDLGLPSGANDWLLDSFGLYVEQLEIIAAVVAAHSSPRSPSSSRRPGSGGRCARSPTTIRRRCRWESRSIRSGRSSGRPQGSSPWSPASCGARNRASSSRCR